MEKNFRVIYAKIGERILGQIYRRILERRPKVIPGGLPGETIGEIPWKTSRGIRK